MRRIHSIISIAVVLVTLSGCGSPKASNNDVQQDNNTTITQSSTDIGESSTKTKDNSEKTENSDSNNTKENNDDQKSFYGNWQIKKVSGYSKQNVGEKESLIGLQISLSNDLATYGNESYDSPKYKTLNKTQDNMTYEYHTDLSKIGIDTDSITQLNVLDKNGKEKMTLFIKDNDTLLYFDEGVFYETKRVS